MQNVNLVGAGLVGSLLSIVLAKRGYQVTIREGRPDMRVEKISAGRSINLALSTRGLHALDLAGLSQQVMAEAIPMRGRMIHSSNGSLVLQPYGRTGTECINSVSRGSLNKLLMTAAEKHGVAIKFNTKVNSVDLEREAPMIGTDGYASAVRHAIAEQPGASWREFPLDYGYKELSISPGPGGSFKMEKHALHIWPRGNFMLIALPNFDGSYTCTLFLPHKGPAPSFESLKSRDDVKVFFRTHFSDALDLIEDAPGTFFENPTGQMVTVKGSPWNLGSKALLVGDAAHAIVPFFGQGMNCGFEDCTLIAQELDTGHSLEHVISTFGAKRRIDSDAIADLAVDNFTEMRDKVGQPAFLLEKEVERVLQNQFPDLYVSRYAMVTFSNAPYSLALRAGVVHQKILGELCRGLKSADDVDLKRAEQLIREHLPVV